MASELHYMNKNVENGADYFITQMFFDNEKYFAFVDRCRKEGIEVPILPGLKPITRKAHLSMLPKTFRSDIPEEFAARIRECKTDAEVKQAGIEWSTKQAKELLEHGAPGIHFYTMSASDSVLEIAKRVF